MKISINAVPAHCFLCFLVIFTINVGIGTYFVYYTYINCDKETGVKYDFFLSNNNLINL